MFFIWLCLCIVSLWMENYVGALAFGLATILTLMHLLTQ